jgi:hypothetical protein
MISDATLAEVFRFEFERSRSLEIAVRAVRRTVEAHLEEQTHQRRRAEQRALTVRCTTGPAPRVVPADEIARVVELVAADSGLRVKAMLRHSTHVCAHGRWVVAAVLKRRGFSYPQIASAMQMSDHTVALYGSRRVDELPELAERRNRVLARLNPSPNQEAA